MGDCKLKTENPMNHSHPIADIVKKHDTEYKGLLTSPFTCEFGRQKDIVRMLYIANVSALRPSYQIDRIHWDKRRVWLKEQCLMNGIDFKPNTPNMVLYNKLIAL